MNHYDWHAMDGATVLTAPTVSPDGRTMYVATGRAPGHSKLHAFALTGELLWQSEPWQSAWHSVDACAVLSSPIVDAEGDIYFNDCKQLSIVLASLGDDGWDRALPELQCLFVLFDVFTRGITSNYSGTRLTVSKMACTFASISKGQ